MKRPALRNAVVAILAGILAAGAAPAHVPIAPKLQPYVDRNIMAGAVVLVADGTRILDLESLGYSDLSTRKPMRADDVFWIASMSKSMTAAAMMMLVDAGRVSLDDPVQKYIPAFKDVRVAGPDRRLVPPSHPITIREILSHTSGLGFLNEADHHIIDSVPLETSIQHDLLEPLAFDPGTKYSYSNEGIDTAGRIIEIVSGIAYDQFLQERLFTPLGMVDTTFHPNGSQLKRLAKSYKATKSAGQPQLEEVHIGFLKYPLDDPARYPAPGGGLFSTAHDVCRFCQMLAAGGTLDGRTYLSPDAVRQMTTKQTGPLVKKNYGFGLEVSDGQRFGHGGAYQTAMTVDHGIIRVFLVQQASAWAAGSPLKDFDEAVRQLYGTPEPASDPSGPVGTQIPSK
jgi:CubicO group peptidase (beta-lactamase class C family)